MDELIVGALVGTGIGAVGGGSGVGASDCSSGCLQNLVRAFEVMELIDC